MLPRMPCLPLWGRRLNDRAIDEACGGRASASSWPTARQCKKELSERYPGTTFSVVSHNTCYPGMDIT